MRVVHFCQQWIPVGCLIGLIAACAVPTRTDTTRPDTPRPAAVAPAPAVASAVAEYKARDPDASFTFAGAHVDSFATTAKTEVPDYALATLRAVGLPTARQNVVKLLTPSQAPLPARDLDAIVRVGRAGRCRGRSRHSIATGWWNGCARIARRWRSSSARRCRS